MATEDKYLKEAKNFGKFSMKSRSLLNQIDTEMEAGDIDKAQKLLDELLDSVFQDGIAFGRK